MSEVKVKLDCGEGDPSDIYIDLVNLPDPVYLALTMRIFNYDDVALYMRVDGYKTGWTFTTNDLGSVGSGANIIRNLDNLGNRSKPAAEGTETITVRLRAYTDSGYTVLKWTYEKVLTITWVKSDDPAYTVDVLNNFDDGTVQGWAVANELNNPSGWPTIAVATDYVLSPPYSARMEQKVNVGSTQHRARLYKSFTTPNKDIVYAILDIRTRFLSGYVYNMNLQIQQDTTVLIYIGRPWASVAEEYFPGNKWLRIVVPLPPNTTLELRIVHTWNPWGAVGQLQWLWLDIFKIISKSL